MSSTGKNTVEGTTIFIQFRQTAFYIYPSLAYTSRTHISKIVTIRYKCKHACDLVPKKQDNYLHLNVCVLSLQFSKYSGTLMNKSKPYLLQKPAINTHRGRKFQQVLYSIQNIFNKGIHLLTEVKHKYITLFRSMCIFTSFLLFYLSCKARH